MSVCSFCLFLFSCEHIPGCSGFSQKKGDGLQRLPMGPVRCRAVGGVTACVPLLGNFAPRLCSRLRTLCWGGFWLVLCRSGCGLSAAGAVCSSPPLPARAAGLRHACSTPGASVQGSAGAHSKPLLKTSAVTLIVGLPFLILSVRQQSAWRFVLSCLNLVNIVSKKLTKVTVL